MVSEENAVHPVSIRKRWTAQLQRLIAEKERHPALLVSWLRWTGAVELVCAVIATLSAILRDLFVIKRFSSVFGDLFGGGASYLLVACAFFFLAYVLELLHELVSLNRWQTMRGPWGSKEE